MKIINFILFIIFVHMAFNVFDVEAEVMWTCKAEFTEANNIIYTDCGYREINEINIPCNNENYYSEILEKTEHYILCQNPEYFPEKEMYLIQDIQPI